jgi:hypothetical protein
MTDEHKAALAEGRSQGRAVRAYLEAIEGHKPKRGRKRTSDSISKRLAAIEDEMLDADALRRLQLTQERINLQRELESTQDTVDLDSLEDEFIRVAKGYAERKGISYAAFRELGVPASTLKQAGIPRSS